jgi:hypothetical protein
MFRCGRCDRVAAPSTPAIEVVLETRPRTYPARRYRLRGESKEREDPGGTGWEIVRVARVCPACVGS